MTQLAAMQNAGARFLAWAWSFLRHHRPAMVGVALVFLIVLTALFGPLLAGYEPDTAFYLPKGLTPEQVAKVELTDTPGPTLELARNAAPRPGHMLGTDTQGYDLLSRMTHGARVTLAIALASMTLSLILGTLVGAIAGFSGGKTDLILMRVVDFTMSFPSFLLAMVAVAVLGFELRNLIIAVGLVLSPMFARQVRAEVLRVRELEFITAARALGLSPQRILFLHVLPNSLAPIIVLGTLGMGSAILDVAGLNFLGLGGDPFEPPEWGLILKQGWNRHPNANLQTAIAGLAIFVTVLGFNLLGDGLKDELDPRTRRRGIR